MYLISHQPPIKFKPKNPHHTKSILLPNVFRCLVAVSDYYQYVFLSLIGEALIKLKRNISKIISLAFKESKATLMLCFFLNYILSHDNSGNLIQYNTKVGFLDLTRPLFAVYYLFILQTSQ